MPPGTLTAAELREVDDGKQVTVAGLVVARQRPGTANGIVFLLLEDETGMINGVVRPDVYERHRAAMRADPLVIVSGRVERRERNLNVLVSEVRRLAPPEATPVEETRRMARARAAAPVGQFYGRGRR
jgi:error-prone DNA polymerase